MINYKAQKKSINYYKGMKKKNLNIYKTDKIREII